MSQTKKILNKNIMAKKTMEKIYKCKWEDLWKKRNWSDLIFSFRLLGGRCIKCGGNITSKNLEFYSFNVEKVTCFQCQKKSNNN